MSVKKYKKKEQQRPVASKKQIANIAKPGIAKYYIPLFFILLITFIVYLPSLKSGFVWDDEPYILNNPAIHIINLKEIFSHYVMGNYHPITMLTYAVEYHFWGISEKGYHAVNLLIHLLNVILVFYVIFLLSGKTEVALTASLLFGIHPLHVESVAWAAELKDLLYAFFFLASYIFYLRYLKDRQMKFYFYCLLLFLLALLSKAMAASLPLVLLLTDYFKEKKINRRTWLEKIPFFALSLIFGIVAIYAQQSEGATDVPFHAFTDRIVFASYGFITYLVKLALPLNLSAFYSYPVSINVPVPVQYYAFPLLCFGLAAYVIYTLRFTKKIAFGIGFFSATVLLVLQLLPVGSSVMADRYSYLPSIGIFYLAGEGLSWLWNKKTAVNNKIVPVMLLSIATIFFSVKTYTRCNVWKNGMSFWNDIINQSPNNQIAYYSRGIIWANEKQYEQALNDFTKAIEADKDYDDAYYNRGLMFAYLNRYGEAINDFSRAIYLKPHYPAAYNNRGILMMRTKRNEEALNDFNMAIKEDGESAQAYYNRGELFSVENKFEEALNDFTKAVEIDPKYAEVYNDFAHIFILQNKFDDAYRNADKAIELQPDYAPAYLNRGIAEYNLDKKDKGCVDFKQAISLGFEPAQKAYNDLCN